WRRLRCLRSSCARTQELASLLRARVPKALQTQLPSHAPLVCSSRAPRVGPEFRRADGESAQLASLALTGFAGKSLPRASSPFDLDLTDRLIVDSALATPHTLSRRCIGPSLNEAWIASPSSLVPNSDFQK